MSNIKFAAWSLSTTGTAGFCGKWSKRPFVVLNFKSVHDPERLLSQKRLRNWGQIGSLNWIVLQLVEKAEDAKQYDYCLSTRWNRYT